jgi:hypothetical protein
MFVDGCACLLSEEKGPTEMGADLGKNDQIT